MFEVTSDGCVNISLGAKNSPLGLFLGSLSRYDEFFLVVELFKFSLFLNLKPDYNMFIVTWDNHAIIDL